MGARGLLPPLTQLPGSLLLCTPGLNQRRHQPRTPTHSPAFSFLEASTFCIQGLPPLREEAPQTLSPCRPCRPCFWEKAAWTFPGYPDPPSPRFLGQCLAHSRCAINVWCMNDSVFYPSLVSALCVLSCVPPFVTSWTVALQAPLSMRFFQARILERVTIFSSRGSSRPRDRTCVSCIGRRILYH